MAFVLLICAVAILIVARLVVTREKPQVEDHNCHCGALWSWHSDSMKERHTPKPGEGSIHTYYRGNNITEAVMNPSVPIEEVIRLVEKECEDELRISESYREKPELLYEGHPWMQFVRSGDAWYLGWDQNHAPGPNLMKQVATRNGTLRMKCPKGHLLSTMATWCELCEEGKPYPPTPPKGAGGGSKSHEPIVDLDTYVPTQAELIPMIKRYDADGRPIYDRRVSAKISKSHLELT